MKKLMRILVSISLIALSGCSDKPVPVEERFPVQPNEGDFSGCYYFEKDGDYYNFIYEIYKFDFRDMQMGNGNELSLLLREYESEREDDDSESHEFKYRCEPEREIGGMAHFAPTGITDETIDEAREALENFDFRVVLIDQESYDKITYVGKLDYLE